MRDEPLNGIGAGAVDLGALRRADVSPELRAEAQEEGEVRAGLRCGGCRRRVSSGYRVHAVLIAFVGGTGAIEHKTETACPDPECGHLLRLIRSEYTVAVEQVSLRFLDDPRVRAAMGLSPDEPEPPAPVTPEPDPVAA